MANTIQIKRGNSTPGDGVLLDGELGFDKANDQLYIGKVDGGNSTTVKIGLKNGVGYNEENQETAVVPLNADTLQGLSASAFAPAGFGLGENTAKKIDSWSNATRNGYYLSVKDTPDGDGNTWHGIVVNYSTALCNQLVWKTWSDFGSLMATRRILEGVPEPWEWVNPPMTAGVEYRTTERYNGKPVYTMLLEGGALAAGTTTFKAHSLNAQIIRCSGNMSKDEFVTSSTIPYSYHDGTSVVSKITIGSNANSVLVTAEAGSFSNYKFRAQIWYIKG